MYPTISDFIYNLTGIYIPMPIQTFGFFMALAFLLSGYLLYREFRRMESEGMIHGMTEKVTVGKPAAPLEIIGNAILGFLVGFKGLAMVMDWTGFVADPQAFLFSSVGNIFGGLIFGGFAGWYKYYESEKEKLDKPQIIEEMVYPHERVGDIIIIAAVVGIVGAKVFTWIEDIEGFMRDPIGAITSFSGLAFYGGLICAPIALIYYCHKKKIHLGHFIDAAAPVVMIAYAVGRLGCHFSGDGDWGIENPFDRPDLLAWLPDWAWSYTYPHNVINSGSVVIPEAECLKFNQTGHCRELAAGVYPTSVYEFLMGTTIFSILMLIRKKIQYIPGLLFGIYLMFNGVERFLIEFVRVNDKYDWFFGLSQAQMIALGISTTGILLSVGLIIRHSQKGK